MPVSKELWNERLWRIVACVKEGGRSFQELLQATAGKDDLSTAEGGGNIAQAIELGYIQAQVTITDSGRKFLAAESEKAKKKG